MQDPTSPNADARTPRELMTQWRKLTELKRSLVRDGLANGDATPSQVIDVIRNAIPVDLFEAK